MTDKRKEWILAGYALFAKGGKQGLKVEVISRAVHKSKSSFYHHFADLELFMELLLAYHFERVKLVAEKELQCNTIDPDMFNVFIEHKEDMLFNRQVRIHREAPLMEDFLVRTHQLMGSSFLQVWQKDLKLDVSRIQLESLFNVALEDFFIQLTPENLNYEWLSGYYKRINEVASNFK